jgi:hypothetical protein
MNRSAKVLSSDAPEHSDFEFYSKWRGEWCAFQTEITVGLLKKYAANGYKFRVLVRRATVDEAIKHLLSI